MKSAKDASSGRKNEVFLNFSLVMPMKQKLGKFNQVKKRVVKTAKDGGRKKEMEEIGMDARTLRAMIWILAFSMVSNYMAHAGRASRDSRAEAADSKYTGSAMYGDFNTNTHVRNSAVGSDELIARSQVGALWTYYFADNGTMAWGADPYTNAYTAPATIGTNAADGAKWTIEAFGDVNGDGKDEILVRNKVDVYGTSPNTYTYAKILFLADNGTVKADNGTTQPPTFTIWERYEVMGMGNFYTNTHPRNSNTGTAELIARSSIGALWTYFFSDNGTMCWSDSPYTNVYTPPQNIGTNAADGADWTVQAIGDVNGDGKDELLVRNTEDTFGTSPNTYSQAKILFFADNGTIKADNGTTQPDPFTIWTRYSVEGMGDFYTNSHPRNSNSGTAELIARSSIGALWTYFFSDNGTMCWSDSPYTNVYTAPATIGTNAADGANWEIQAIGDVNADGQDELVFRNTAETLGTAPNTYSRAKIMFFADNGTLKADNGTTQPDEFTIWTRYTIEGMKGGKKSN